jgi:hypothetical protein
MVKLGASVDSSGMQRFYQALREASNVSEASAASISGAFFKAQTEIVGGFVAIGTAALGLVDKVAMADQQYRMFAMHMFISKDAARSLKIGMDALGASMGEIRWDPTGELQGRMQQLQEDQRAMAPSGDYDAQMRKIRDVRFEFTRMDVELQLIGMNTVQAFMKALGTGPDELLTKLQTFNHLVTTNVPMIVDKIVKLFMPVWTDLKGVFTATWEAIKATGVAFTDLVGLFSGDRSIEDSTFSLEKFATAVTHIVHGFAIFAEAIANVEELLADFIGGLTGDQAAGDAFFAHWKAKTVGFVAGGIAGGVLGAPFGPVGIAIGSMLGAGLGANIADKVGGPSSSEDAATGGTPNALAAQAADLAQSVSKTTGIKADLLWAQWAHETGGTPNALAAQAADLAQSVSKTTGIKADLLWAQWAHETGGFTHLGQLNNLAGIRLPGTTTYQPFSSLADFGKRYAEVVGNTARYAGLAGAQNTDEFAGILKRGGYYEDSEKNYAAGMAHYDTMFQNPANAPRTGGSVTVGSMTININKPHPSNDEVASVVTRRLQDLQGKAVQRNLAQQQDYAYDY